jgi:HemY protein
MLRSLFFIIKLALLAALVIWVVQNPGTISIAWMDYKLTAHVGLFILAIVIVIMIALVINGLVNALVNIPSSFRRAAKIKAYDQGLLALSRGMAAIAAGDARQASIQSKRAQKYLPPHQSLSLLLQAQTAQINGKQHAAQKVFKQLSLDKDAGFLGVRALLQEALDAGDYNKARSFVDEALQVNGKNPWLLQIAYQVAIHEKSWNAALEHLKKIEKYQAVEAGKIASDRVALLIAQADEEGAGQALYHLEKAHKIDPFFLPTIQRLAAYYKERGNRKKAIAMIKAAWKNNPHPDLVALWVQNIPASKAKKATAQVNWIEKLVKLNPQHLESYAALGHVCLNAGLWGDARQHLLKAESVAQPSPPRSLYESLAELERKEFSNEQAAQEWLTKGRASDLGNAWICMVTGRHYDRWSPIAAPHDAFNTIRWGKASVSLEHASTRLVPNY